MRYQLINTAEEHGRPRDGWERSSEFKSCLCSRCGLFVKAPNSIELDYHPDSEYFFVKADRNIIEIISVDILRMICKEDGTKYDNEIAPVIMPKGGRDYVAIITIASSQRVFLRGSDGGMYYYCPECKRKELFIVGKPQLVIPPNATLTRGASDVVIPKALFPRNGGLVVSKEHKDWALIERIKTDGLRHRTCRVDIVGAPADGFSLSDDDVEAETSELCEYLEYRRNAM